MHKFKLIYIIVIICIISINHSLCAETEKKKVHFAAFYLDALFFETEDGKFSGFAYDLITEIAKHENWDLSFSMHGFPELLNLLKTNKDPDANIVSFVAFDKQRTQYLSYTNMSIIDVCGALIVQEGNRLSSINELNGKTVALLSKALPSIFLKNLIDDLHIKCTLLGFNDYNEIMEYIKKEPDTLLLVDNFTFAYNKAYDPKYKNLESTLLVLPSFSMRFVTRKNINPDITNKINYYIDKWRNEPDSPYAKLYKKWGRPQAQNTGFLSNLTITQLMIIPVIVILLLLWIFMLRYRVRVSTIKIKAREQDLKATLMSIGDGVIVTDTDGLILEINQVASKILNIENINDFNPTTDITLLDRSSMEKLANPISQIISTKTLSIESDICILRNNSKSDCIIAFTASPIFVLKALKGAVFVFKDITEDAENASRIMRSERKLSAILESVNEAILVFDTDLKLTQVNKYAQKLISQELGKTDVIGAARSDITFYDDVENKTKPLTKSIRIKNNITSVSVTKSNKIYQIITSPIFNDNGEVINLIQAIMDITELKANEQALQISENNYRMLVENQSDLVTKRTPEGKILFATASCCKFFGLSYDEFINHNYLDFIYPDDREFAIEAMKNMPEEESSLSIEIRHKTPAGIRWVSWQVAKVLGKAGNVEAYISTGRDITEAKVANEQLQHVQKLEAIGQLAGGVAHDFNNMLGGIVGFAELIMMQSKNNQTISNYSKNIIDTSEKAAELTKQLLTFARKGKSSSTPIDAHSAIKRAVDILKRSISKNIDIELSLNAKNSLITGDPTQIQNIILNLGINARDAIGDEPKGSFTIETTVVNLSSTYCEHSDFDIVPQSYLLIKARDNGEGMEKEILDHIFEPFFTTKEVGKGTGLGLASIFGSVTSHSGAITATSEAGFGTEFDIFLPLIENADNAVGPDTSTDLMNILSDDAHKIILVIDDEEIIRMVAKSLLENLGYEVLLAKDGQEGVEIFSINKDIISVIILDVIMPRMGGKETLQNIKSISPNVKVIMASGFTQTDKEDDFLKLGAVDFIHKPYRQKELYSVLEKTFHPKD